MNSPKVSVIVTSYNQEDFIGPALESILSQDYENVEILACDDCSADDTLDVLRQMAESDERVRVVTTDRNAGLSENRNRGLRVHSGEFVALLDGDDLMRPGKISAQVAMLEANPNAAGCLHDAEIFNSDDGAKLGLFSQHAGARGLRPGGAALWLNPTFVVLPSTMMFRSNCIPDHLFDTRLPFAADWLFSIEVFHRGDCVVIDEVYVDYRRHGNQLSADSATKGFEEGMMVMALVDARCPELAHLTRTMRTALIYGEARRCMQAGEQRPAARFAFAAARAGGLAGHVRLAAQVLDSRWGSLLAAGR